jgi:hypothetical protein
MHKAVAETLGVSNGTVERAIAILMKTGRILLSEPVEPPKLATTDPAQPAA